MTARSIPRRAAKPTAEIAEIPIAPCGKVEVSAHVIHSPASQAARLEARARHTAAVAQIDAELEEDRASRLTLDMPPISLPPLGLPPPDQPTAPFDAAVVDWLREYGPFRRRRDKRQQQPQWQTERLQAAKDKFPGQRITRDLLRAIGRTLGPGFS